MTKPYRLGVYEKAFPNSMSLKEKLCNARELGYDYLELSIDESDEKLARLKLDQTGRRKMVRDILDAQLPIGSICLSGHRKFPLGSADAQVREHSLQIMEDALTLGESLGIHTIQLAGYDVYYEPPHPRSREFFVENLRRCADMACRSGIVIAFETMETPFMDTVKKAMEYVRLIDCPYLQVYPDVGNCTNAAVLYGHDVVEDLHSGKGHLVAVHLKETKPGHYREVEFGEGHVNFNAVVKECLAQGVRRFVTELWNVPRFPWHEHIQRSKAFIDQVFAKIEKGPC